MNNAESGYLISVCQLLRDIRGRYRGVIFSVLVHIYTALGVLCSLAAVISIADGNIHHAFLWLFCSMAIDLTDGFMARHFNVLTHMPSINGEKMDAIVDYVNITFIPMLILTTFDWFPEPRYVWVAIPLISSLLVYCRNLKIEKPAGFCQFPAVYSIFVFYTFILFNGYLSIIIMYIIVLLELSPIHFLRPRDAYLFRRPLLFGGLLWFTILVWILLTYPNYSYGVAMFSTIYPLFYLLASLYAFIKWRRAAQKNH